MEECPLQVQGSNWIATGSEAAAEQAQQLEEAILRLAGIGNLDWFRARHTNWWGVG
uniref:Uncharacterized protein n=1 Tax=Setaria viridis TaxID=4556 RepID=A0A4U6WC91_SETVI|nr:hypothetical protein SEVIR_1G233750v2 [Setaria viridis]